MSRKSTKINLDSKGLISIQGSGCLLLAHHNIDKFEIRKIAPTTIGDFYRVQYAEEFHRRMPIRLNCDGSFLNSFLNPLLPNVPQRERLAKILIII